MAKSKRYQKTLADYAGIAISPLLIMVLVGSLAFFVLEVLYSGEFASRLRWILFWFTMAIVLVARIGIEQGQQQARMYGLALAAVTSLVVMRFSDAPLLAMVFLGGIWWCTDQLTWDCTLIDDSQDASGQGLTHAAGLEPTALDDREAAKQYQKKVKQKAERDGKQEKVPKWKKKLQKQRGKSDRPHAPGTWIVYFSLIALPIFGGGQLWLNGSESADTGAAFRYLLVYVTSGLGLLLVTSFLGLRRYLRQRKLNMPTRMAGTWIGAGVSLIAVILVLCLLLPRPQATYSLTAILDRQAEEGEGPQANNTALLNRDSGEGDGQRSGAKNEGDETEQQDPNQQQDGGKNDRSGQPGEQGNGQTEEKTESKRDGDGKESGGEKKGENQKQGDQGEQRGGEEQTGKQENERNSSESKNTRSPGNFGSTFQNLFGSFAKLVKWILYLVFAVVGLVLLWKYRAELIDGLRQWWQSLMTLFGRNSATRDTAETEAETAPAPQRSFGEYPNPFRMGTPEAERAVVQTYEALKAWAIDQGLPAHDDLTPREFTQLLADEFFMNDPDGSFRDGVLRLGEWYGRLAYAETPPPRNSLPTLERLWNALEQMHQTGQPKKIEAPVG